ncbi:MAG: hypothetical protein Kow0077_08550 [Anaerolineae bacterium]
MSELAGRVFRSYEIIKELGRGGMAVVYLARQHSMDRLVAVKVISRVYSEDPDFRARFDQEARTIARLEHPYILPVIDYGEEDFGAFLVMRYVGGGTLEKRLEDGPLRLSAARDMLARIAAALDYAHSKGVVHRDLKPANILLDEADNPYLTDFGIAKLLQSSQHLTRTGAAVGTPAYMAPEQWKAEEVGPYTDQYALGVVLYQMVTGDLPFKADTTFGYMHKHIYESPEPPRMFLQELSHAAEAVILRALEKAPDARFSSVGAMSEAFSAALIGGVTPPAPLDVVRTDEQTLPGDEVFIPPPEYEDPVTVPAAAPEPAPTLAAPASPARTQGGGRGLIVLAAVLTVIALAAAALLTGGFGLLDRAPEVTPTTPLVVAAAPTDEPEDAAAAGELAATQGQPPSVIPSSTPRPATTVPPTPTPDGTATAESDAQATLQAVARALTSTANAALIDLATQQVALTATAVERARATSTPTATATPSHTPTRTPSATWTPFSVPTVIARFTGTPSLLLTAFAPTQSRPTAVVFITPTLAPTARRLASCPGLLPSRLGPGDIGQVSDEDPRPVNVRREPGLDATRIDSFPINTRFEVLRGPICASGYPWFEVRRLSDGKSGWVAESGEGVYYLEPVNTARPESSCPEAMPARLSVGARAVVDTPNGLPLRLHREPGGETAVSALVVNRQTLVVLEGPQCRDAMRWWLVRTPDDRRGWATEADHDSYFMSPAN